MQYHTVLSQVPRSIILQGVMWPFRICFEGTVQANKIFDLFFHNSSLPWPRCNHNGLKFFDFYKDFAEFVEFFEIDSAQYVWYCAESLFTAQSQRQFLKTVAQARDSVIKTNIFSDYAKKGLYFSFLQQSLRIKFLFDSVFLIPNFEYLGENKTKFENILNHGSVAQTNLNDEQN